MTKSGTHLATDPVLAHGVRELHHMIDELEVLEPEAVWALHLLARRAVQTAHARPVNGPEERAEMRRWLKMYPPVFPPRRRVKNRKLKAISKRV